MERIVTLKQSQPNVKERNSRLTEKRAVFLLLFALGLILFSRFFHDSINVIYERKNFLSFHTILEFLSINVSLLITIQGLIMFPYQMSRRRLMISALFLAIGSLDLLHTLSYEGMPFFITESSIIKATWFWVIARLSESLGLLIFLGKKDRFVLKNRRYNIITVLVLYVVLIASIIIYFEKYLPLLFVPGRGLTPLKIGIEYFVSSVHLLTLILITLQYKKEQKVSQLSLIVSITFLFLSELIFTIYQDIYDFDNLLGHFYKATGYIFLLRGIYITTFEWPFIEKQSAEREHHKSQQQLMWMLERIPGAFFAIDKEDKIIVANYHANEIFFKKEHHLELIGKSFQKILNEKGLANYPSSVIRALETGEVFSKAKIHLGQNVFQADITPIIDPYSEKILGAGAYFVDITDEENAYRQWNEMFIDYITQAENLQQLIDAIPTGFLAIDNEERIIAVNEECKKIFFSKNKDVLVGTSLKEFLNHQDDYQKAPILRALHGEEIKGEFFPRNEQLFLITTQPIRSTKEDKIIGAVALYQNVTELEKLRGEMNQLDRLHIVSQMAASITHEIRNPMTAVRGFIQLLQEKSSQEFQNYFEIILKELDRANQIISDFLAFSRTRKVEEKEYNLNEIIYGLHPILLADSNIKGQYIELDLDQNVPSLLVNENEIKQLILNLARNAMESMEDGGELVIRTRFIDGKVELQITDSGIGISKEQKKRLFEPFYTTKERGTGLGLAVCKNIVDKHNGRIEVDSELGKGTTFTIIL